MLPKRVDVAQTPICWSLPHHSHPSTNSLLLLTSTMSNPVGSSVDATLLSPPTNTTLNTVISPSVFYSHTRPVTPPQNLTASNPISTPISNKTSGSHKHASETHGRDSANLRLAEETTGLFLGAMPPQSFLDKFLPISPGTQSCPEAKGAFKKVLRAERELQMYQPFVSIILVIISPGFHLRLIDNSNSIICRSVEINRRTRQPRYLVR